MKYDTPCCNRKGDRDRLLRGAIIDATRLLVLSVFSMTYEEVLMDRGRF